MKLSFSPVRAGPKKHGIGCMATRKPRIGVTGPSEGGYAAWITTRFLIWWNGGKAVRISPAHKRQIQDLDGLVIGGGADINPERYKEEVLATLKQESKLAHKIGLAFFASV